MPEGARHRAGLVDKALVLTRESAALRAGVPGLLNMTDRHARRITSVLLESGTLTSESSRAPLRLAFPARLAARWMPGLFPEKPGG